MEKIAGVSNATAERYLDELEKEGSSTGLGVKKLTQHGTIGQKVFYTLKLSFRRIPQRVELFAFSERVFVLEIRHCRPSSDGRARLS